MKSKHGKAFRIRCIKRILEIGYGGMHQVAREKKIPNNTIHNWMNQYKAGNPNYQIPGEQPASKSKRIGVDLVVTHKFTTKKKWTGKNKIFWDKEECSSVCRSAALIIIEDPFMTMGKLMQRAQLCLPAERRRGAGNCGTDPRIRTGIKEELKKLLPTGNHQKFNGDITKVCSSALLEELLRREGAFKELCGLHNP